MKKSFVVIVVLISSVFLSLLCLKILLKTDIKATIGKNVNKTVINKIDDGLCIPYVRFGLITPKTSETDLKVLFGRKNVETLATVAEDGSEVFYSLVLSRTNNEFLVFWKDDSYKKPYYVISCKNHSKWKTVEGISAGTSLEKLNKINGKVFCFYGFRCVGSGRVVNWGNGLLSKKEGFEIDMGYDDDVKIPDTLQGDIRIRSDDETLKNLKLRVCGMSIYLSK